MHAGRSFRADEVLRWSGGPILWSLGLASVPTLLYQVAGLRFLALPWLPLGLLGVAVAFYLGFKNNSAYNRLWESRQAFGQIVHASRTFAILVLDYVRAPEGPGAAGDPHVSEAHRELVYRHLAWLTTLRYQLRSLQPWEHHSPNAAYFRRRYRAAEYAGSLEEELAAFVAPEERSWVLARSNPATHFLARQSARLAALRDEGLLTDFTHMELKRWIATLYEHQGACERLKNYPFPRQYATVNLVFVRLFILLLPFGILGELKQMGDGWVWLTIPLSGLVSWVFQVMDMIGDYSENPFEGLAMDTPVTALSRGVEIELREMLGETELPPAVRPVHQVLT